MIQHILYVFVVVANFYDSHFSICDVLVFQSKKISFASEIWERQVCQPLRHIGCGNESITCYTVNYMSIFV